jgi:hypothetical protein
MSTQGDPWQAAWATMNARAWWNMEHGHYFESGVRPWLQLWNDAGGFNDGSIHPTLFTVFRRWEHEPLVRRAVWQRSRDLERVHAVVQETGRHATTEPTIAYTNASLEARVLEDLLGEIRGISIPVTWQVDCGSATTDCGEIGFMYTNPAWDPPAVLELRWGFETPPEWAPLRDWWHKAWDLLEATCDRANPREGAR